MMSEDERLREALEAELEDSYQEYLTLALKGETQEQMQTSPEYERRMKELCRQMEKAETKQPEATEATGGSNIVMLQPTRRKTKRVYTIAKIAGGLAAVAAVFLVILISSFSDSGLHSRGNEDELNIGYDNSSQSMEVGANDLTNKDQNPPAVRSEVAMANEVEATEHDTTADVNAVPVGENTIPLYVCTVVGTTNASGEAKKYLRGYDKLDIEGVVSSQKPAEVPGVDHVEDGENSVQLLENEPFRIKCEIPKADEVAFSGINWVKVNGREVAFTVTAKEETEQTIALTVDCSVAIESVNAVLQVDKVYLNVSYGDGSITFVCKVAVKK